MTNPIRNIRICTGITLLMSAAAFASPQDSTLYIPFGSWNMSTQDAMAITLPAGVSTSDILAFSATLYSDPDIHGQTETHQLDCPSSLTKRNEYEGTDLMGDIKRGGWAYLDAGSSTVGPRIVIYARGWTSGNHPGGNGGRFHESGWWFKYIQTHVDGNPNNPIYNRGYLRIRFRGLKTGFSAVATSQPFAVRRAVIALGPRDLETNYSSVVHNVDLAAAGISHKRITSMEVLLHNDHTVPLNNAGFPGTTATGGLVSYMTSVKNGGARPVYPNGAHSGSAPMMVYANASGLKLQTAEVDGIFRGVNKNSGGQNLNLRYRQTTHNRGYVKIDYIAAACGEFYGFYYQNLPGASTPANNCGGSNNNTQFIQTSGADIWGTADNAGLQVADAWETNKTVYARILSIEKTSDWAKFGVVMRRNLAANSAYAGVLVNPGAGGGVMWHYRSSDGAATVRTNPVPLTPPVWVRVKKTGNSFTGAYSTNSTNGTNGTWTNVGTQTLQAFSSTYAVGLAASSNSSYLNTSIATNTTATSP